MNYYDKTPLGEYLTSLFIKYIYEIKSLPKKSLQNKARKNSLSMRDFISY